MKKFKRYKKYLQQIKMYLQNNIYILICSHKLQEGANLITVQYSKCIINYYNLNISNIYCPIGFLINGKNKTTENLLCCKIIK